LNEINCGIRLVGGLRPASPCSQPPATQRTSGYVSGPQITPLAPLLAHRAYRPVGRSLRLGERISADLVNWLMSRIVNWSEDSFHFILINDSTIGSSNCVYWLQALFRWFTQSSVLIAQHYKIGSVFCFLSHNMRKYLQILKKRAFINSTNCPGLVP
jgi:hypothetical protein